MATMYNVPLTTNPSQSFTSTIPVDGSKMKFYFFLRFNTVAECWILDIKDSTNTMLLASVPLVRGINLLEQYSYLKIGSAYLYRTDDSIIDDIPNENNLGTNFLLYWSDTPTS